jgi:hypothetical protein
MVRKAGSERKSFEPDRWIHDRTQARVHIRAQVRGGNLDSRQAAQQRNHDRMPAVVAGLTVCLECDPRHFVDCHDSFPFGSYATGSLLDDIDAGTSVIDAA